MSLFDIDFNDLVRLLNPPKLRKEKTLDWLRSLIKPVKYLQSLFLGKRNSALYQLKHTGQVVYLEAALNDRFDPITRGIYIEDSELPDPIYVYKQSESKPVFLYTATETTPKYLYTQQETINAGADFIVNVPNTVSFDPEEMKALVRSLKLVSKMFIIQVI